MESQRDTPAVEQISRELFAPGAKNTRFVEKTSDLGAALASFLRPDVSLQPAAPEVGFIHRKLADADLYFLANTGNRPHSFTATFRTTRSGAEWWDPFSGEVSGAGSRPTLSMTLAPYESRVLVFSDHAMPIKTAAAVTHFAPIDLSHDWRVTFEKAGESKTMQTLHSWADDEAGRYYSGTVSYTRSIDISQAIANAGSVLLDFGMGTPLETSRLNQPGMQAWFDAPLRDAAIVYVNGRRAGAVWHPPFFLEIAPFLHAGSNELKIVVANTAINEMAGHALPDYRLLWQRYGERFTPQDMDQIKPLPSGILGPLRIVSAQDAAAAEAH
jgi:hypothetical protein